MTVATNDANERYEINGAGPYAFSFRIFNDTDLTVVALSTDEPPEVVPLTYLTHYTVTGANVSSGGSITLTSAAYTPYDGYTVDIRSNTPQDQPTSIRNQARFLPEIHEDAFDYLSRQIQDLNRRLDRTVRFSDDNLTDGEMSPIQSWLLKYLTIGPTGLLEPATLTSSGALTATIIGELIYPRTTAEIAASVTPTNYFIESGYIERYGTNTSPGVTDMSAALAAASLQAEESGGAPIKSRSICHIASSTTVNGHFDVGRIQCFSATSTVVFALGTVTEIYPEWWGAKPDGVIADGTGTDSHAAFLKAITAATLDGAGAVGIHPIKVGPGNFVVGALVFPPATDFSGSGIHVTNFVAKTGTTGNWFEDDGSAAKISLRGFAGYGRNLAGLTGGVDLGNNATDFGTEGFISDIWMRDLLADAPGFYIRGNIGCAGRLIAQDTGGLRFVGTGSMCEQIVNMSPKGFDVGGTDYCTEIGGLRLDSLHVEAPATNTIPVMYSDNASLDMITVSFTNGRTHSHVVELDASTTSYRIGLIFYYFQSSPSITITNGNIKLADGTYIGGNATNGSHSGEGGYSSGEIHTSTTFGVKAQQKTAFKIRAVNTAGTIQHRIGCQSDSSVAGTMHAKISGASQTLTNTPTGADGSTAFATGAKIGSANTNALYFDTATQVQADFIADTAEIVFNNTGVDYTLIPQVVSININGSTLVRLAMFLQNSTTGANVAWATALNDAGDTLDIVFSGYLR
jgi:hypothetical protein